jgi:hypothetical protein
VSGSILKGALPILIKNTMVLVEGELISKTVHTGVGNDYMKQYIITSEVAANLIKKISPGR